MSKQRAAHGADLEEQHATAVREPQRTENLGRKPAWTRGFAGLEFRHALILVQRVYGAAWCRSR